MKKLFIGALVLFLCFPLFGQQRTGNIYGKIVDSEGNPLPGASVTLTGSLTAPVTAVSSGEGVFRFLSLSPGKDYALKAELQGFKPKTEEGIIIAVGANVDFTIVMEIGTLEEQVTVTAVTPVVDSKKTSISQTVNQDTLQSLPTARDPWVVLQMAPSVMADRENIGGNESGQQAAMVSHGASNDYNNIWSIDGAMVTDISSTGSPNYYDFDSFEEMNITIGGADVTQQTGGIGLNLVTRRGGNKMSIGGRFIYTEERLQADNLTDALRKEGVTAVNKVMDIRDYGFNMGGPLLKDKIWWWGSFGVQDIKTMTILATADNSLLTNINGKFNLQLLPQNRMEIYLAGARKEKWGRSASYATPLGSHQTNNYHFGNPVIKIQDEHMFGDNFFVSGKFNFVDSGFFLAAMYNEDTGKIGLYNVTDARYDQDWGKSGSARGRWDWELNASYFNDKLLNMSHEVKFGFYYSTRRTWSKGLNYPSLRYKYNTPQYDITGDGKADIVPNLYQLRTSRFSEASSAQDAMSAYVQDTISVGRFNVILGLRWDRQSPFIQPYDVRYNVDKAYKIWVDNSTQKTGDVLSALLPVMPIPEIKPDYRWDVISPRFGVTWDVQGDGKTVAKLFFGQYGDYMMTGQSAYFRPLGTGGYIYYWWLDNNGDKRFDYTELYWHNKSTYKPSRVFDDAGNFVGDWNATSGVMWSDFDPANPTQTKSPTYTVDKSAKSTRTQEILASINRELRKDLGVAINFTYKTYDNYAWNIPYYPATGYARSMDDFVQAGVIPSEIGGQSTGESAGKPYYLLGPVVKNKTDFTSYQLYTQRPDFKNSYWGMDIVVVKRLSNKWMMDASFTLQGQSVDYGKGFYDSNQSSNYLNPTNVWAIDKNTYAPFVGGSSGKINQYVFSRWLVKLSGLYQLPWDLNVSGTFQAREGNIIPEYFDIVDYTAPNPDSRTVTIIANKFGKLRLPTFYNINLRAEKMLRMGDFGKVYVFVDLFNLLNSNIINRRYARDLGTYYIYSKTDLSKNKYVPEPTNFMANEVLNPRLARFGVRFLF